MAELNTESRNALHDKTFAIPEERKFPIPDISHARNALARAAGTKYEKRVRDAVYRKYPSLKTDAQKDDPGSSDVHVDGPIGRRPYNVGGVADIARDIGTTKSAMTLNVRLLKDGSINMTPMRADPGPAGGQQDAAAGEVDQEAASKPVTVRAQVTEVYETANGEKSYECGVLMSDTGMDNATNISDSRVILGLTAPTRLAANPGDVLDVEADALMVDQEAHTTTWRGAQVIGVAEEGAQPDDFKSVVEAHESDGALIKKAGDERIVYGVVLRPNFVDSQGDTMTADDVEAAAHYYLENARTIGLRHQGRLAGAVLESYIAPVDFTLGRGDVKKGDWVLVIRVDNDEVWQQIKDGDLDAFSVGGFGTRQQT